MELIFLEKPQVLDLEIKKLICLLAKETLFQKKYSIYIFWHVLYKILVLTWNTWAATMNYWITLCKYEPLDQSSLGIVGVPPTMVGIWKVWSLWSLDKWRDWAFELHMR